MENLTFTFKAPRSAGGTLKQAITGVVASGNLEVLLERVLEPFICQVDIATTAHGFETVWREVVKDFVERRAAGGLRISINDGGARPDTVALRLAQGAKLIEDDAS